MGLSDCIALITFSYWHHENLVDNTEHGRPVISLHIWRTKRLSVCILSSILHRCRDMARVRILLSTGVGGLRNALLRGEAVNLGFQNLASRNNVMWCMVQNIFRYFELFKNDSRVWWTDGETDRWTLDRHSKRKYRDSLRCAAKNVKVPRSFPTIKRYNDWNRCKKKIVLPRCMQCRRGLAMRKLSIRLSVRCLFVCQRRGLWQKGRKICPDLYTIRKII